MMMNLNELFEQVTENPDALKDLKLSKEEYDWVRAKLESETEENPRLKALLARKTPWE